MMDKHTPGPWVFEDYDGYADGIYAFPIEALPVAKITQDHANWTGNARLISAAPDLLAACETHVRLEEIHRAQPQRGVDFEDSFAQMKAAIAKAKP